MSVWQLRLALIAGVVAGIGAFVVGWVIRGMVPELSYVWMADFSVFRAGGEAVLAGLPVYELRVDAADIASQLPFTYPPFAALLFVPLGLLGKHAAEFGWLALNIVALGGTVWAALRLMGKRSWLLVVSGVALAHLLDPVLSNAVLGQINVLIMALVLLVFTPQLPARWQGVLIGLAAGIKLTPLIFVVYLCCIGRWRAALWAMGTFVATVLLGFALVPDSASTYWFDGLFPDAARVLIDPVGVNHSLAGLFSRLSGSLTAPRWVLPVCAVVGILGLGAAAAVHRRGHVLLGVLVVAFTAVLVSPVTWAPHLVWIVPALVWLLTSQWTVERPVVAVYILAVVWFTVPLYWLAQRFPDATGLVYQHTLAGNLLATLGSPLTPIMLALLFLPVWLRRLSPTFIEVVDGGRARTG